MSIAALCHLSWSFAAQLSPLCQLNIRVRAAAAEE
jgi:hypothetical protein